MQADFDDDGGFDCDEEGGDEPLIQELDLECVVSRTPPELLEHTLLSEAVSSGEPTPMPDELPHVPYMHTCKLDSIWSAPYATCHFLSLCVYSSKWRS